MSEPKDRTDRDDERTGTAGPGDETQPTAEPGETAAAAPAGDDALARAEAQLRRSMADLANLRKRMLREVEDARRRAIEGLAAELLPVLDNFHLALGVKDQQEQGSGQFDPDAVVEGMRMVKSMLEGVLERHGLTEIAADGQPFDPNLHEAVGVDNAAEAEAGRVTQVLQRGYRLGDKVLRASRVMVRG